MPTGHHEHQIAQTAAHTLQAMQATYSTLAAQHAAAVEGLALAELRCRRMGDALRRLGATEAEVDELVNGDLDAIARRSA